MIVYHGTTKGRVRQITSQGFLPKKPSRRVWFAESRRYAQGRAKTQARRAHDRAVVLTCDINLERMRDMLGAHCIFHKNKIIAINGPVPAAVLRSHPHLGTPASPESLVIWVNRLLGLKPHKGPGKRHPGIIRLSEWVDNRKIRQPHTAIHPSELVQLARQWLPEFFKGIKIDPKNLKVHRIPTNIKVEDEPAKINPKEEEALKCILASNAKRRIRGLKLLAELNEPDLFDWCVMFLNDESIDVQVEALHTMLQCRDGDLPVIQPFAESENKRIRGAAIAALAKHSGKDAPQWFEFGLKDTYPVVRLETAALLPELDPVKYKEIFELALYDPNPKIRSLAKKLAAGKGFKKFW